MTAPPPAPILEAAQARLGAPALSSATYAAALASRARSSGRRPLSVADVAADLSRRAQAQPRRREMAGLRGSLWRFRAAPGAGDARRSARGAARRPEADPPLGQAQSGPRQRRGDDRGRRGARQLRRWIARWPATDIVGLWEALAKRFSQMGGNSGPSFLRMVGKDTFVLTYSVRCRAEALERR